MSKELPKESQPSTKQPEFFKISAKKTETVPNRISQGDIFENIEIIEHLELEKDLITVKKISFPYVVCLNQECDLENDFKTSNTGETKCNNNLLHLAIAPAFIFEQFLSDTHWGEIFTPNSSAGRTRKGSKKIIDNEIPRFHYLRFPDPDMPELIIDFKHFFTINRSLLYSQIDKRLCSLDDLFKEKINQRFSYYISRIGLPEK